MPPISDRRKIKSALDSKFPGTRKRGNQEFNYRADNGLPSIRVTAPNAHGGNPPIKPGTLKSIIGQMRLTVGQFNDFVRCNMSKKGYVAHIKSIPPKG